MTPNSPPNPVFIQQGSKQVTHVLFSKTTNNPIVYSGNRNGDLIIYNYLYRRPVYSANSNKQSILTIVELGANNILTHSRNGCIYNWTGQDIDKLSPKCVYEKEAYTFCQISVGIDTHLMFAPSKEPSVIDCIVMGSYEIINQLKGATGSRDRGMLMSLKAVDCNQLMAGYENGELAVYDLRQFKEISTLQIFSGQPVICFDYNIDKNVGICGSSENVLKQFSVSSGLQEEASLELVNPGLNCVTVRKSDARLFATGGWDSRVRLFSLKKFKPLVVLDFHKDAVNSIDFSGENLMACGSNDCIISFWDLYN